jgi:hypothetical protein
MHTVSWLSLGRGEAILGEISDLRMVEQVLRYPVPTPNLLAYMFTRRQATV